MDSCVIIGLIIILATSFTLALIFVMIQFSAENRDRIEWEDFKRKNKIKKSAKSRIKR